MPHRIHEPDGAHSQPQELPPAAPSSSPVPLAAAQAAAYIALGLWPILSMKTFEMVTGRKRDPWLEQAVGALLVAVGASLGVAAARRRESTETTVLGAGAAGALAAVYLAYSCRGRISKVYLLDGLGQLGLLAAWGIVTAARRAPPSSESRAPAAP